MFVLGKAKGQTGVTVTVSDGINPAVAQTFQVTVVAPRPPTLGTFPNVQMIVGASTNVSAPLTAGAIPVSKLTFTASFDPSVLTNVTFSYDGTNLTAQITAGTAAGSTTVTVHVNDGYTDVSQQFTVQVRTAGALVLGPIADQATVADVPVTIVLNVTSPNVDLNLVQFAATHTNTTLVTGVAFSHVNGNEQAIISLGSKQAGNDYITITANDGFMTVMQSFALHVTGPVLHVSLSNGTVALSFKGAPGDVYTMQTATSLLGPWNDVGTLTVDASGNVNYTATVGAGSGPLWVRAVLK